MALAWHAELISMLSMFALGWIMSRIWHERE
jgi:hypothetical protein